MSKFCENCGSELQDTDKVCPNCGASVEETTAKDVKIEDNNPIKDGETKSNEAKSPNGFKKFFKEKKNLCFAIGGIAIVLILIIVLAIAFGGKGYETPVKNLFNGMEKASSKTVLKAFPDFMVDELKEEDDFDYDDFDDELEDVLDDLEDEYGKNVKISYKILDAEKIDKDDLEDIQDDLEDEYDDVKKSKLKVTKGYKLTVKYTVKGKDDSDSDTMTLRVYKVGGKWCIISSSILNSLY